MEIKTKTLIVLARKYNDIYYSFSTEEWRSHNRHILLIIPNRANANSFPCQNKFDKVIILPPDKFVPYKKIFSYYIVLSKFLKCVRGDTIIMSNPEMFFNRVIYKLTKSKRVIFVEDGLMNYYHYSANYGLIKRFVSLLFGVNNNKYLNKIIKTYLNYPQMAKYYFGEKVPLAISDNINISQLLNNRVSIPNLNGKRIFISQDVLRYGEHNIYKQEMLFNSIIKKFDIDYYVPREEYYKEKILGCDVLNINNTGITLELLAGKYNFEIFGFSTSLLFTLKTINPNIKSHRIISSNCPDLNIPQILLENTDIVESLD